MPTPILRLRAARYLVPAAALLALAGCNPAHVTIDGHGGVPFETLDLTDKHIHAVTLLGPDAVRIVHGAKFGIHIDGSASARAALRFVLDDGKLGIGRDPLANGGRDVAVITVTTPEIDAINLAGSGDVSADSLTGGAIAVSIGGSGRASAAHIDTPKLDLSVMGSGSFTGSGHAEKLDLSLAGSGDVDLARLTTGSAAVDIAGSGTAELSSDGPITGSVAGSGTVTVHGKARCDVSIAGSGKVNCQP